MVPGEGGENIVPGEGGETEISQEGMAGGHFSDTTTDTMDIDENENPEVVENNAPSGDGEAAAPDPNAAPAAPAAQETPEAGKTADPPPAADTKPAGLESSFLGKDEAGKGTFKAEDLFSFVDKGNDFSPEAAPAAAPNSAAVPPGAATAAPPPVAAPAAPAAPAEPAKADWEVRHEENQKYETDIRNAMNAPLDNYNKAIAANYTHDQAVQYVNQENEKQISLEMSRRSSLSNEKFQSDQASSFKSQQEMEQFKGKAASNEQVIINEMITDKADAMSGVRNYQQLFFDAKEGAGDETMWALGLMSGGKDLSKLKPDEMSQLWTKFSANMQNMRMLARISKNKFANSPKMRDALIGKVRQIKDQEAINKGRGKMSPQKGSQGRVTGPGAAAPKEENEVQSWLAEGSDQKELVPTV